MDRKFLDVNALAVFLDESHIGHAYLRRALGPGFEGAFQILVSAHVLLRVRWVLVTQWGTPPGEADRAVADLARLRGPTYVDGDGDTVLHAFELAETTGHDVYDCYLTALAKRGEATHLVTTDSGLRRVCETVGIAYENPVPSSVLARFRVRGRRGE